MLTCSYGLLYIIHCLLIINDLGEVDCKTLFSTKVFPDDNVYLQNLGENIQFGKTALYSNTLILVKLN